MNIKLKLKLNAYSKVDLTNVLTAEDLQAILNNYYTADQVDEKLGAISDIDTNAIDKAISDAAAALDKAEEAISIATEISTDLDSVNALITTGKVVLNKETGEEGFLVTEKEKTLLERFTDDEDGVILNCGTAIK
jgi:hypothetical protein